MSARFISEFEWNAIWQPGRHKQQLLCNTQTARKREKENLGNVLFCATHVRGLKSPRSIKRGGR